MMTMNAIPKGLIIASYRKNGITLNCRVSDGFYCVTVSFRRTVRTHYSKDKDEMNNYIKKALQDGFRRAST